MGLENYWKQSIHNLEPVLNFVEPVTSAIGNFLTSGENYDPNKGVINNFTESFTTPSNLFEDSWMSDDMDLTFGGGDVPSASGYTTTINDVHNPNNVNSDSSTFTSNIPDLLKASTYANANPVYGPQNFPAGIDTADDRFRREAAANLKRNTGNNTNTSPNNYEPRQGGGSGGGGGGSVPSAPVLNTRTFPFTSRTPSGSVYAPDLSAYNDSSLFNYTGPGGALEFTYGQGLPTQGAGYDIWGSPSNIANPYFSGQFATEPTGPADAAINMPAVEMPAGVPGIGGSNNADNSIVNPPYIPSSTIHPSMPGFTGGGGTGGGGTGPDGKDLTYQETIDYFGLTPTSTTFPGPNDKLIEEQRLNKNAIKQTLPYSNIPYTPHALTPEERNALSSMGKTPNDYGMTWNDGANEAGNTGLLNHTINDGTVSARDNALFNLARMEEERRTFTQSNYTNDGTVSARDNALFNLARMEQERDTIGQAGYTNDGTISKEDQGRFDRARSLRFPGDEDAAFDANGGYDMGEMDDGRFKYEDLLARDVAEGMADNQGALMAWGQGLQDKWNAQEAIQKKDNLFNQHFDRNQAEYTAPLFDGDPIQAAIELEYPGATEITDFTDALYEGDDPVLKAKALRAYKKILAEDNVIKTTGHSREEPNSYNMDSSLLDRELGTGDAEPHQILPRVNAFRPPRPDNPADITGRTAYEHPGAKAAYADFLNLPDDSYEKELHLGQIAGESTSNLTAAELSDNLDAITAKYEGSTTETSGVAELEEIINAIVTSNGGLPADSYAVQDEGTDTGELSTRDLVTPSLPYFNAGSHSSATGPAREGQISGRGDGLGQALKNKAIIESIFTKPEPAPVISSGPSLFVPNNFQAQVKPSVAKTQNNMTVPIKRDEKLTARYGQPYRRYGL